MAGGLPLPALVGSVVVVGTVCAIMLMASVHRSAQAGVSGGYQETSISAVPLAAPREFASNAELLKEYESLSLELSVLKAQLSKVELRLHDEALPPNVAGITNLAGPFGRAARNQAAAAALPAAFSSKRDPIETDSIFVSVASFRDDECARTIRDMFVKAKFPRRLFIGAIQQNDPADKNMDCMPEEYATCPPGSWCAADNVRVRKVSAVSAKGPTFGRYVAMLMYRNEKYFMMIDSHNRFVREWDYRLIAMYRLIPSKKGVLSHYPSAWVNDGQSLENQGHVTVMCNGHYIGTGFIRMDGMVMERSAVPRLQPFSAAGFLFADAKMVMEVPFDPNLDFLFDGEEILYSARMWTHGWDLYAPSESILFHYYIRSHAPRVWSVPNNNWWPHQQVSNARVQLFLKVTVENSTELMVTEEKVRKSPRSFEDQRRLLADLDKYGLGQDRTLEDYWKFAMVDPLKRKTSNDYCTKARSLGKL